jgi:hypothetical protein
VAFIPDFTIKSAPSNCPSFASRNSCLGALWNDLGAARCRPPFSVALKKFNFCGFRGVHVYLSLSTNMNPKGLQIPELVRHGSLGVASDRAPAALRGIWGQENT